MNLQMNKDQLLDVLGKMVDVAFKGTRSEADNVGKLTIIYNPKEMTFKASNGYLSVDYKVTENVSTSESGTFTVDADVFYRVAKSIGSKSEGVKIAFEMDGDMLKLHEVGSKAKKHAKLQLSATHHDFNIEKPKGATIKLETDIFNRGVSRVAPFASNLGYDIRFQMVCLHFFPNETRYVCGDGGCFAIYEYPQNNNINKEIACILPKPQAEILQKLFANTPNFEIVLKKSEYYFQGGPVTAILQGIPVDEYVNYGLHAYQHDENKALAVFDMDIQDLLDAMGLVGAVENKSEIKQGDTHAFKLTASNEGQVNILVDGPTAKYRCEIDKPCTFYKLSQDKFCSIYAHKFIRDISNAVVDPQIRFHCITEDNGGVIVVESAKINAVVKDNRGIPKGPAKGEERLLFFCAATRDN